MAGTSVTNPGSAKVDVVLIGAGMMSATLGVLLHQLEPDWTFEMIERLDTPASESSNCWNNAGTGHSALCELNYAPMDDQGVVHVEKALSINEQFQISRQFWAYQVSQGVLSEPRKFINSTPHMSLVWGAENVDYLRKRYEALKASPLFSGMEFSTDRAKIAEWAPLTMEGQPEDQVFAATWSPAGTDVNFGEITRQYIAYLSGLTQFTLRTGCEVRKIRRNGEGGWRITSRDLKSGETRSIDARFLFIGAGGGTLPLLQSTGIPEADDYAGFPVGGSFLVSETPEVTGRHLAKVYGKAGVGAPPMSVPHLDARVLDGGKHVVLFGPFATFSTKFLKTGSYLDLPATVRPTNLLPMLRVGMSNFDLVTYLAGQLLMSETDKIKQLHDFYPNAKAEDWRLVQAGQRVQVIKRDAKKGGVLKLGTEVVSSQDGTVAALLGASPGASTAAPIMLDLLGRSFRDKLATPEWQEKIRAIVPSYGLKLNDNPEMLDAEWQRTAQLLELAIAPVPVVSGGLAAPVPTGTIKPVSDIAL
ncbi:malate dehydrogenase (quinone) [Paenirhodobacter enshiensis]|uniref:malate dehydrogenase (quinone) n=1 Tax=Paenirhodobacter enshiensis TaxID=1105367 RepID=UPI0005671B30|nr:malate dehydrogenase (quinone) [Paenirhodobacter enshiensis]